MGFAALGRLHNQYPRSSVSDLPFLTNRSSVAARAIWQLYSDGLITKEFEDIKLIALFGFGVSGLHFVQPIKTLDDLKGLKILVNGRSDSRLVELLGATPLSSNPAEFYQTLNLAYHGARAQDQESPSRWSATSTPPWVRSRWCPRT